MPDHRTRRYIRLAAGLCVVATTMFVNRASAQDPRFSSSVSALASPNPAARAAAACELGRIGARAAIPQLIALLEDGTPLPRQIVCGIEPPFEDESWAPNHAEVLEPSPGEAAARALIALRSKAAAPLKQTLAGAAHWRA